MTDPQIKRESKAHKLSQRNNQLSSFSHVIRGVENLINEEEQSTQNLLELPKQSTLRRGINNCMTNNDKLKVLMRNPQIRDRVAVYLRQNGYMDLLPILKVSFSKTNRRQKEPEVSESDLQDVFKRFEHLQKILIKALGVYVVFSDYHSAYFAQKAMNDLQLESLQAKLVVQWCPSSEYGQLNDYFADAGIEHSYCQTQSKFTCRYEIQIDSDKEFQVARKIIGNKGYNMKRIIDACLGQTGADPKSQSDTIKLRLRGKGSGYKEGPSKLESLQPLHLCVSCRDETIYKKVCKLVEDLLRGIYKEYKVFCQKNGRRMQELSVKKLDIGQVSPQKPNASCYEHPTEINQTSSGQQLEKIGSSEIKSYIQARNKARRELNFSEADRIRNYLRSRGVVLVDEKGGRGRGVEVTTWRFSN